MSDRSISTLRTLGLLGAVGGAFLLGRAILATVYVGGRGPDAIPIGAAAEERIFLEAVGWEIFVVSGIMIVAGALLLLYAPGGDASVTDGDE